jgi:hypothetical protein
LHKITTIGVWFMFLLPCPIMVVEGFFKVTKAIWNTTKLRCMWDSLDMLWGGALWL